MYQTKRQVNVSAPNPLVIQDMTHMCKFAYEFYAEKVAALQKLVPAPASAPAPAPAPLPTEEALGETTKPAGKVSQHPGADDKDSEEEEEKGVEDEKTRETKKEEEDVKEIVNEVADA